jgi:hypothetical protein
MVRSVRLSFADRRKYGELRHRPDDLSGDLEHKSKRDLLEPRATTPGRRTAELPLGRKRL